MISKLVRRLYSINSLRKRQIPVIINQKAEITPEIKRTSVDTQENSREIINSVIKFDDLRAIYQKQSKTDTSSCSFENFEEIPNLSVDLLTQMNKNGIFKPTQIQKNMLGHFFASPKSDLLIKSHPGSGKSLGYVIVLLSKYYESKLSVKIVPKDLSSSSKINCKYLIIVPSELLAKQVLNWIQILSGKEKISSILCETFENVYNEADFLVATPEAYRIKMARGLIDLKCLETVVLDEADALIKPLKRFASAKQKEMRAKHPVTSMILLNEIMKTFASNKLLTRPRMIVSSATLNNLTRSQLISTGIVKDSIFLEDKRPIITKKEDLNPIESKVQHFHALMKNQDDPNELVQLIHKIASNNPGKLGVIFIPASQSKLGLSGLLQSSEEFSNVSIELLCNRRNNSNDQLLIASDIDCRGIDIPQLSYVIILDLPSDTEGYIHMAGRVGRTGQSNGKVYTILGTVEDFNRFTSLLRQINLTTIPFFE